MPIYEYKCNDCEQTHEIIQKFSDDPITICPKCKGLLKKIISNTSFVLKGSGWYVTDYPSAERKKAMGDVSSEKTSSNTHSDSTAGKAGAAGIDGASGIDKKVTSPTPVTSPSPDKASGSRAETNTPPAPKTVTNTASDI